MTDPNYQPVTNLIAPDHELEVEKAISRERVVSDIIPTHGPGLLDLPTEIRLMIFRHLLFHPPGIETASFSTTFRPAVDLLRTNREIHREAFDILYRENRFYSYVGFAYFAPIRSPRVVHAIQNIGINLTVYKEVIPPSGFLELGRIYGKTSTIRGSLVIILWSFTEILHPLTWFVPAMGEFTNFKKIELELFDGYGRVSDLYLSQVCNYLQTNLEHVFGHAERFEKACNEYGRRKCLRFYPVDHQNRERNRDREQRTDDLADSLDGIRLEWNEPLKIKGKSEKLASN